MKLTIKQREELYTLIAHAQEDIRYGAEGTYSTLDEHGERVVDEEAIERAENSIRFLLKESYK